MSALEMDKLASLDAEHAAAFEAVVRGRRSIRGFTDEQVSEELLHEIFSLAQLAPSNCNVQPWIVHVVSGTAADRLRARLYAQGDAGAEIRLEIPALWTYPGKYRDRQINAAKALYAATNIAREDVEGRRQSILRNYEFFDAPHACFIFMADWCGSPETAAVGMYAQTLMLAFAAHGIGSCAQGALGHYAEIVHEELGVPADHRLFFGISFGYPDPLHPANAALTDRASLSESTVFHT